MKKIFTLIIACATCISMMAQFESAPAFPGAEGHGRFTTGARAASSPTVVHVTNLNDSGTGSFRAAVTGGKGRIIVFDVAGVIALKSDISMKDNITIEGQTAPYPGITLRYYTVRPGANNIIRFIRFRRGQELDVNDGADASWQRNKTLMMIDHCSLSWSIDEVASFYDNNNFTMQWCTIAESLLNAGHGKGAHGYGGIWGGKLASFHHNMIAHVANRGPRFNGARYEWDGYTSNTMYSTYNWKNTIEAENVDFRNCVMYNAQGTCYGGPGGGQINIVNNYYKAGPVSNSNMDVITTVTVGAEGNSSGHPNIYGMTSRYFINGNTTETNSGTINQNTDWSGVRYDSGIYTLNGETYTQDNSNYYTTVDHQTINGVSCVKIKLDEAAPSGYVTTHAAADAFTQVVDYAGASLYRDPVDERYANEAKNGTTTYTGSVCGKNGLIDIVADCNGYTESNFPTATREDGFDSDNDGIPDAWETANGLNPKSASDATKKTLDPKGYYTNIEVYCNSLVEDIMKAGNAKGTANYEEYYPAISSATGISNVTATASSKDDVCYNLAGQRVDKSARGIIISNGRKYVNK